MDYEAGWRSDAVRIGGAGALDAAGSSGVVGGVVTSGGGALLAGCAACGAGRLFGGGQRTLAAHTGRSTGGLFRYGHAAIVTHVRLTVVKRYRLVAITWRCRTGMASQPVRGVDIRVALLRCSIALVTILPQGTLGLIRRTQIANTAPNDLPGNQHRITLVIRWIITRFSIEQIRPSNATRLVRAVTLNATCASQNRPRFVTILRRTLPAQLRISVTARHLRRTQRTQATHPTDLTGRVQPRYAAIPLRVLGAILHRNPIVRVALPLGATVTGQPIRGIDQSVAAITRTGCAT